MNELVLAKTSTGALVPADGEAAPITKREADVLKFMNNYRAIEQCNPTMAEIAEHFGWASRNAAADHLASLARKGAVRLRYGKARGYVVLVPNAVAA